ncbi:MAG TPA: hypothetical protein VJ850_09050 [Candidatus Limnocylindrales bacterium]|nr:hypothetical protein [Candidatus Limnocylindrales bacterium]
MSRSLAPQFKHAIAFCGMAGPVDDVAAGQECHRLPMHHGEHRAFVNGTGVRQPKAAGSKSLKSASKVVTINGAQFRVPLAKDGSPIFTKATPVVTRDDSVVAKPLVIETSKAGMARRAAAASKAAPKRRRQPLSAKAAGDLAVAVEQGSVTPSAALSRVAASQRGRRNRPVKVAAAN